MIPNGPGSCPASAGRLPQDAPWMLSSSSLSGVPRFIWFLLRMAATLTAVAVGGTMLVMSA